MTKYYEISKENIQALPGDATGDLEQWLTSLSNTDVYDVLDMLYSDDDVVKLVALAVQIYCNEMDLEHFPENGGKKAIELFMTLSHEVGKEIMIRHSIVSKQDNMRRKLYKHSNISLILEP